MTNTVGLATARSVTDNRLQLVAAVFAYVFLGILTPLQLYSGEQSGIIGLNFILCMVILQISAFRIALIAAKKPKFMALTFYFFVYIWIGWAGGLHTYVGRFPWPDVHQPHHLTASLSAILLAIFFYEVGRHWAKRLAEVRERQRLPRCSYALSYRRLTWLWLFSFLGFAYGLAYFGFGGVLGARSAYFGSVAAEMAGVSSLLVARSLLRIPCLITFLACLLVVLNSWHSLTAARQRMLILMLISSGVLALIANYPPAIARSWLGTVALTPLFLLTPYVRQSGLVWVLLLTFILVWIFPRADLFRYESDLESALLRLRTQESVKRHVHSVDYDVLQMSVNTHTYVEQNGILWGKNFLTAGLFFVPRSIWRSKPGRSDLIIAKGIRYRQRNLSVPLWAESFLGFGWFGIFFVFLLYGYWSSKLDGAYAYGKEVGNTLVSGAASLLLPFLAAYQFYFLRGNLITGVSFALPAILAIWFLFKSVAVPTDEPASGITDV